MAKRNSVRFNFQDWLSEYKTALSPSEVNKWSTLHKKVTSCEKCVLHSLCTQKVFGTGNPKARVLIVGESPGKFEDNSGVPFVGKAGKFFREALQRAGFIKGDLYLTTAVKCRPPDNRVPKAGESGSCFMHVFNQVELVDPQIIVPLGSVALKEFSTDSNRKIGSSRGEMHSAFGYRVCPTWHPSYVLRMCSKLRARELLRDLRKVYEYAFPDRIKENEPLDDNWDEFE